MILKNKIKTLKFLNIFIIIIIIFGVFSITPLVANSAEYILLKSLPGVPASVGGQKGLGDYLTAIFKLAIGIASILAVLMIIIGGFQYITAETISTTNDAKKRIQDAILGLIIALAAWLILNTINVNLVDFNTNLEDVTAPPPEWTTGGSTGGSGGSGIKVP